MARWWAAPASTRDRSPPSAAGERSFVIINVASRRIFLRSARSFSQRNCKIRGSGGTGRHTILRGWRRKAWGFKSPLPHQSNLPSEELEKNSQTAVVEHHDYTYYYHPHHCLLLPHHRRAAAERQKRRYSCRV